MIHSQKNVYKLENCVIARKMSHSQRNGSQLEKMSRSYKKVLEIVKCVRVKKCATLTKMGHSQKNWSQLKT